MTSTQARPDLLADRFAPRYDVLQARHLLVEAPAERAYSALRSLDFTEIGGGLVNLAFWARGLPERWKNRHHRMPRVPTRLTFDDLVTGSEWAILGERPGSEIVLGVAGQFWKPVVVWRRVEPDRFIDFAEPGFGKIVLSLSAAPYGGTHTLLTYDVRVILGDGWSRAKFWVYWTTVSPFIRAIQTATLRTIARHAEAAEPKA
ncbi:hypothetical protein ORV05_14565 [Amycolatopsis cynarae]|uniref:DUF2867 domain-containing protein n=1 Tax=Amycolatopsis cynarae TaxID=2995223 RepID=A0ABY7BE85_9PSEU|nr:hypothetical protein [Amycolatopsis sp. HUAS 11-8]WAL68933.1 hypothetical protein ORV05_14565 [Amycolatopsis sp. HUAS 11-8]